MIYVLVKLPITYEEYLDLSTNICERIKSFKEKMYIELSHFMCFLFLFKITENKSKNMFV